MGANDAAMALAEAMVGSRKGVPETISYLSGLVTLAAGDLIEVDDLDAQVTGVEVVLGDVPVTDLPHRRAPGHGVARSQPAEARSPDTRLVLAWCARSRFDRPDRGPLLPRS